MGPLFYLRARSSRNFCSTQRLAPTLRLSGGASLVLSPSLSATGDLIFQTTPARVRTTCSTVITIDKKYDFGGFTPAVGVSYLF